MWVSLTQPRHYGTLTQSTGVADWFFHYVLLTIPLVQDRHHQRIDPTRADQVQLLPLVELTVAEMQHSLKQRHSDLTKWMSSQQTLSGHLQMSMKSSSTIMDRTRTTQKTRMTRSRCIDQSSQLMAEMDLTHSILSRFKFNIKVSWVDDDVWGFINRTNSWTSRFLSVAL